MTISSPFYPGDLLEQVFLDRTSCSWFEVSNATRGCPSTWRVSLEFASNRSLDKWVGELETFYRDGNPRPVPSGSTVTLLNVERWAGQRDLEGESRGGSYASILSNRRFQIRPARGTSYLATPESPPPKQQARRRHCGSSCARSTAIQACSPGQLRSAKSSSARDRAARRGARRPRPHHLDGTLRRRPSWSATSAFLCGISLRPAGARDLHAWQTPNHLSIREVLRGPRVHRSRLWHDRSCSSASARSCCSRRRPATNPSRRTEARRGVAPGGSRSRPPRRAQGCLRGAQEGCWPCTSLEVVEVDKKATPPVRCRSARGQPRSVEEVRRRLVSGRPTPERA